MSFEWKRVGVMDSDSGDDGRDELTNTCKVNNMLTMQTARCLTGELQNDNQPTRSVLIQASDGHVVGRERVAAGDKEPTDDVE